MTLIAVNILGCLDFLCYIFKLFTFYVGLIQNTLHFIAVLIQDIS
jgi:hypothetical protein